MSLTHFLKAIALIALIPLFVPLSAFALGGSVFAGTVTRTYPCLNISATYVVLDSTTTPLFYAHQVSQGPYGDKTPVKNQYIVGTVGNKAKCTIFFPFFTSIPGNFILYYASSTPQALSTASGVAVSGIAPTVGNPGSSQGISSQALTSGVMKLLSGSGSTFAKLFGGIFGSGSGGGGSQGGVSSLLGGSFGGGGGGSLSGSMMPYGGPVLFSVPCTCNSDGSFAVTLGPPSAGTYFYSPIMLTMPYPYYSFIVPGAYHLGFYSYGGICMVGVEPYCYSVPITRGTIIEAGTSK